MGHFRIGEEEGGAAILEADASQFVVIEAKLMSPLSKGTKYALDFDQAARNVSCIAETLARSARRPEAMTTIGFCLVAPQAQQDSGIFGDLLISRASGRRFNGALQVMNNGLTPTGR